LAPLKFISKIYFKGAHILLVRQNMKTVIVVFLLFLQGFCASAYQTFDSSQALLAETTLDPEDIEKVTNLLENP
jgi:hypothetical protein